MKKHFPNPLSLILYLLIVMMLLFGGIMLLLIFNSTSISRQADLLPQKQPGTVWISDASDIYFITEADGTFRAFILYENEYRPLRVEYRGGSRICDLCFGEKTLVYGRFHAKNDRFIVTVADDSRGESSDARFLNGRKRIVFERYAFTEGIDLLPFEYAP